MSDIFHLIKAVRECVGDSVFVSLVNIPSVLVMGWYTRRRFIRNRWFSTVSDKKRFAAFAMIKSLWPDGIEPDDFTRAEIKTIFESIGLNWSLKINRLVLRALEKESISYKDYNMNCLLKCWYVMDVTANSFIYSDKKICSRKWWLIWFCIVALALFCSGFIVSVLHSSEPVLSPFSVSLTWLYIIAWGWVLCNSIDEWGMMNRGKVIHKRIAPYLQAEGIQTHHEPGEVQT